MEQPTLLDTMSQRASERCEEILAEARAKAESIHATAQEEQIRRRDTTLAEAREAMKRLARQNRGRVAAESEKRALVMQEVIVDELLARVDDRLAAIATGTDFEPILEALVREAFGDVATECQEGGSGCVVHVPSAYARQCEHWLEGLGITGADVRPDSALVDGVIVEDRLHSFRIVNTLSSRYAHVREEARKLCLKRLFGERPGDGA